MVAVKTSDIAHAANILVSAGLLATGTAPLAVIGAAAGGYLSLNELTKLIRRKAPSKLDWVTQELTKALNDPNSSISEDTRRLIPQMIEMGMPTPDEFTANGLEPKALIKLMLEKQTYDEMKMANVAGPFRQIVKPLLKHLLNDREFTSELAPSLWREVLKRQERLEDKVDGVPQAVVDLLLKQGLITQQGQDHAVPLADLIELADKFGAEPNLTPDALVQFLSFKAEEYRSYRALIDGLDERVAAIANLKGAAQDAAGRLDFEEVEMLLSRVDVVETEIAAETKKARAANALLRGRVQQAYDILSAAADSFASVDGVEPSRRRFDYTKMLYEHGLQFAGEASELALEMWGKAATDVDRAVDATLWAALQNSLGEALRTLGERESGTARLELAVQAYEAALTEWMRDKVPLEWATTQNNLGNALQALGARENGTTRLVQAVHAYENALTERTRDKVPLEWAGTQNNLGNALLTLGVQKRDTAPLELAVQAFEIALLERTRDKVPLDWAMTQNNLGSALSILGARESGMARLELAVQAYENALTVRTRDKVPMQWAGTQNNLGGVYLAIFDKSDYQAVLDRSEAHLRAALEVFEPAAPHYAGMAQRQLDKIAERRLRG